MTDRFEIPKLKIRERTGIYAPGKARILQILEAAYDLVMTQGYSALTLRAIARQCGIRVGAISHYYKTKEDLIKDLLESAVAAYQDYAQEIVSNELTSPSQKLEQFIILVLEDIRTEKTTKFYPELWALANHDHFVSNLIDTTYSQQRKIISGLIADVNQSINLHTIEILSLYISGTLEGMTIFIGYNRSRAYMFDAIKNTAVNNLVSLVKFAKDDDFSLRARAKAGTPNAE